MNPKSFLKLLIGFIVLTTIGALIAIFPYYQDLTSTSKNVAEKETILGSFTAKEYALQTLKINYEHASINSKSLYTALPKKKNVTNMLNSLESLAGLEQVSITSYAYKKSDDQNKNVKAKKNGQQSETDLGLLETEKDGDIYRVPFEIALKGSYTHVKTYLDKLEYLNRFLIIDRVKITKLLPMKEVTTPPDQVEATITLYAYMKK